MRLQVDSGAEYLIPFAKKKLAQVRSEMNAAGLNLLNRIFQVDASLIFVQASSQGFEIIRITGGSFAWAKIEQSSFPFKKYRALIDSQCKVMRAFNVTPDDYQFLSDTTDSLDYFHFLQSDFLWLRYGSAQPGSYSHLYLMFGSQVESGCYYRYSFQEYANYLQGVGSPPGNENVFVTLPLFSLVNYWCHPNREYILLVWTKQTPSRVTAVNGLDGARDVDRITKRTVGVTKIVANILPDSSGLLKWNPQISTLFSKTFDGDLSLMYEFGYSNYGSDLRIEGIHVDEELENAYISYRWSESVSGFISDDKQFSRSTTEGAIIPLAVGAGAVVRTINEYSAGYAGNPTNSYQYKLVSYQLFCRSKLHVYELLNIDSWESPNYPALKQTSSTELFHNGASIYTKTKSGDAFGLGGGNTYLQSQFKGAIGFGSNFPNTYSSVPGGAMVAVHIVERDSPANPIASERTIVFNGAVKYFEKLRETQYSTPLDGSSPSPISPPYYRVSFDQSQSYPVFSWAGPNPFEL